ncbi:hypothetical protein LTR62_004985 [Meristemomyces frigidus]|uniref:Uncharacterized protein n=1 Tax=Meristemomyces frigidus TaxID=1508187 RepID=A0AAN7TPI0_9PEZI|nr:hypothetical protein LTR62_004985 [Meristemomyces frigidus]
MSSVAGGLEQGDNASSSIAAVEPTPTVSASHSNSSGLKKQKSSPKLPKDSPADSRYQTSRWNPFSSNTSSNCLSFATNITLKGSRTQEPTASPPASSTRSLYSGPRHAARDARLSIPIFYRNELQLIQDNINLSRRGLAERDQRERLYRQESDFAGWMVGSGPGVVGSAGLSPKAPGFSPSAAGGGLREGRAPGEYLRLAREGILRRISEGSPTADQGVAGRVQPSRRSLSPCSPTGSTVGAGETSSTTPQRTLTGSITSGIRKKRSSLPLWGSSLEDVLDGALHDSYLEGFAAAQRKGSISPTSPGTFLGLSGPWEGGSEVPQYEGKGKGRACGNPNASFAAGRAPGATPPVFAERRSLTATTVQNTTGKPWRDSAASRCSFHTAIAQTPPAIITKTEGTYQATALRKAQESEHTSS